MAKTFTKQTREVFDYDTTMEDFFEGLDDEIDSVTIEVDNISTPPLVIGPGVHPDYEIIGDPGQTLKIWIGAGKDGEKYKITALITTVAERLAEHEFFIKIKDT